MQNPTTEVLTIDGFSQDVLVQHLEGNHYRICGAEIRLFNEEYNVGDVVEAHRNSDNELAVIQLVEPGNFRSFQFILPLGWAEKPEMVNVLNHILAVGGEWEGFFGGILLVALPPDTSYDPSDEIANAYRSP